MPMDDDYLAAIIESDIDDAMGNFSGDLSSDRERAMDYYYGRPYGDEQQDRSKIVTREFLEAVENAMPGLMRIFAASGQFVEFDAIGAGDDEQAKVDTMAVRHVFVKENDGFIILYNWFKDALRQRNGIVKIWYESNVEVVEARRQLVDLTDDALSLLYDDSSIEIIEHTERTESLDGNGSFGPLHDVVVKVTKRTGRVIVENVPPEEFLISARARHLDPMKADFCAHRTDKTISELRSMGVDEKILDNLPTGSELEGQTESIARNQTSDEDDIYKSKLARDTQEVTYYECRKLIDYDEDGIEEWRRITYVGGQIIENEEATGENQVFFCAISPFPQPHRFLGAGYFEMFEDVQHVSSVLLRNALDSIYRANENRTAYQEGEVDVEDLWDRRFDGTIACTRAPSEVLFPLPQQNIPPQTFDLMNRIDQIGRRRSGVGEGVTGLSETAIAHAKTGVVDDVTEHASELQGLIARVFAETGVKDLFWDIHNLLRNNHEGNITFPYLDGFIETNPKTWRERVSLTANVGLGTGNKNRDIVLNKSIQELQEKLLPLGMVNYDNIYNTAADLIEISGKADPSRYFTRIDEAQGDGQGQGGVSPAQVLAANAGQGGDAQAFLQAEQLKTQARLQTDQAKLQLEGIKQLRQEALERLKMAQDHAEKMTELELKYSTNVPGSAV